MAKFKIVDYIDIGSGGPHGATTWKVYKDETKSILLDSSIFDEVNKTVWHSPLPIEGVPGEFYSDLEGFYVEVTMHMNIVPGDTNSGHKSDPFLMGPFSQRDEVIKITDGDLVSYSTAKELGWYNE